MFSRGNVCINTQQMTSVTISLSQSSCASLSTNKRCASVVCHSTAPPVPCPPPPSSTPQTYLTGTQRFETVQTRPRDTLNCVKLVSPTLVEKVSAALVSGGVKGDTLPSSQLLEGDRILQDPLACETVVTSDRASSSRPHLGVHTLFVSSQSDFFFRQDVSAALPMALVGVARRRGSEPAVSAQHFSLLTLVESLELHGVVAEADRDLGGFDSGSSVCSGVGELLLFVRLRGEP